MRRLSDDFDFDARGMAESHALGAIMATRVGAVDRARRLAALAATWACDLERLPAVKIEPEQQPAPRFGGEGWR